MAIVERKTQTGNTIKVEVTRRVSDKVLWADGYNITDGRKYYEGMTIAIINAQGKVMAKGSRLDILSGPACASMMAKGATARIGDSYIGAELQALIESVIAEAEAAEQGDAEFWALKMAHEARLAQAAEEAKANEKEDYEYEMLQRRMDDPNSDL